MCIHAKTWLSCVMPVSCIFPDTAIPRLAYHKLIPSANQLLVLGGYADGQAIGDMYRLAYPEVLSGWCQVVARKLACRVLQRVCDWCMDVQTSQCLIDVHRAAVNCSSETQRRLECPARMPCASTTHCQSCLSNDNCIYK